jgi:hypothetical protein
MARTKGAKDAKPRKLAVKKPPKPKPKPVTPSPAAGIPPIQRPDLPADDFKAAIAAELQSSNAGSNSPGQDTAPPQAGPQPASAFDPTTLTVDGLASAWQVPFWLLGHVLAMFRVIPNAEPVIAVGKRRAKDLAKPSYAIYEHYSREYLGLHPDNAVHVAAGVTALDAIGIVPEIIEACIKSRRQAVAAVGTQGQPTPVPGTGT